MTEQKPKKVEIVKTLEGLRKFKKLNGDIDIQREVLVTIEGEPGLYTHWADLPTKQEEEEKKPGNDNVEEKG